MRFAAGRLRALPVASGTYKVLVCADVYSQVRRFRQTSDCSLGGVVAISRISAPRPSGAVPNTIIRTGLASVSRSSSRVFRFVSTVRGSTFECSLDGGPWLGCSTPKSYESLVTGSHAFEVRAIGPSGKEDPPPPPRATWIVNTHLRTVTLTTPTSGSTTKNNQPPFSGAAGTAPGDSARITVKVFSGSSTAGSVADTLKATALGGTWSEAPSVPLADGIYTAVAKQSEDGGSTAFSAPTTFTVDTAPRIDEAGSALGGNEPTSGPAVAALGDLGTDNLPATYSVGGSVSGLSGTVVLEDNGGDDLSVSSDGPFTFATPVADGDGYDVTVKTNPSGRICTVSGASGTVDSVNVASARVTCSGSTSAADDFDRADGGLGAGWAAMSDGGLSIASQAVVGSAGSIAGDVWVGDSYSGDQYSQIEVTSASLSVGDWVGPTVRSQNGGQDTYMGLYWNDQLTGNYVLVVYVRKSGNPWIQLGGIYTLDGPLPAGTQLRLSAIGSRISFQENGLERIGVTDSSLTVGAPGLMTHGTATADNWAGGEATASGSGSYSVGGSVSGLSGTVVLEDNGGDDLSVSSDGPFTFATPVADGDGYDVTVKTNPSGRICTVSGASGTVDSVNVASARVTCKPPSLQIQYAGTDAQGVMSYDFTSADDGYGVHVLRVLAPSDPRPGVPHNFLYVLPIEPELGSTYGDGIETLASLDAEDQYNLTIVEPSFPIDPWYADNSNDPNLQFETFLTKDLVPWVTQNLTPSAASQPLAPVTGQEQNWLIGFSKSGLGAQDLILKHPDVFSVAASWDFPADMSSYTQFGSSSASNYATDANFQANYRLTPSFVDSHKTPFLSENRIWIGGYEDIETDVADYDALLTSEGILHTTETPHAMPHRWDGGWVPIVLSALSQDSAALSGTP